MHKHEMSDALLSWKLSSRFDARSFSRIVISI